MNKTPNGFWSIVTTFLIGFIVNEVRTILEISFEGGLFLCVVAAIIFVIAEKLLDQKYGEGKESEPKP